MFDKKNVSALDLGDRLVEVQINSYRNKYNRKIDIDVLKEGSISFMVESKHRDFEAVIYESHKLEQDDMIRYSIYLKRPDGSLDKAEGGDLIVRAPRFTVFNILGASSYRHSRKSKDIRLLDWAKLKEAC